MKSEVSTAISELQQQFDSASMSMRDDGQGGAFVVLEPISLGTIYEPHKTWIGFHIPAQYPYADIYPIFVGANVKRVDERPFQAPITPNHKFEGRPALQVSRRYGNAQAGLQKAKSKILKVLDFLRRLQ